jgi:drug/metabolite transporter (DMT)-like permease
MDKKAKISLTNRYLLTGVGLGLYFGLFFRPLREPDYLYALFLAFVAGVVMTILHVWRERPSLRSLPFQFVTTTIKAAIVLLLLEGRHLAFDMGGKFAVILFTGIMGAVTGLWFAYAQNRQND